MTPAQQNQPTMTPQRVRSFLSLVGLATSALLTNTGSVSAQAAAPDPEETAVREAVQNYIDGIMRYDEELLRETFEADAHLQAAFPNGLYSSSFNRWVRFTDRPLPDTSGYVNEITWVEVSGTAAVARTDLWWPRVHYVDYLSLVKLEDGWQIVNKTWYQEERRPGDHAEDTD